MQLCLIDQASSCPSDHSSIYGYLVMLLSCQRDHYDYSSDLSQLSWFAVCSVIILRSYPKGHASSCQEWSCSTLSEWSCLILCKRLCLSLHDWSWEVCLKDLSCLTDPFSVWPLSTWSLASFSSSFSCPALTYPSFACLSLHCLTPISYPSPPLPALLLPVLFYLSLLSPALRFPAWIYSSFPLCPAFYWLHWPNLGWIILLQTRFSDDDSNIFLREYFDWQ